LEGPFQLLLQTASAGDAECTNKLLEIDVAALVFIKDVENILSKLPRIAKGEKLFVYPTKLCLVQMTRWTVLFKTLVPLLEFLLVEVGVFFGDLPAVLETVYSVICPWW